MTDVTLDEVRDAVEKATDKSTFSLVEAIKGRGYPTDQVTVYLNADAAYNLAETNALLSVLAARTETDEYETLDAVAQQLKAEVLASAMTIHLRGISPGELNKISKKVRKQGAEEGLDEDEVSLKLTAAWIAPHIVRVERADGAVDEHLWSPDEVETLMDLLPQTEWLKIDQAINKLSFTSAYYDQLVDAGFLSKS